MQEKLSINTTDIKFFAGNICQEGQIRLLAFTAKCTEEPDILSVHIQVYWVELTKFIECDLAPVDIPIVLEVVKKN